jgi:hypothetical protein
MDKKWPSTAFLGLYAALLFLLSRFTTFRQNDQGCPPLQSIVLTNSQGALCSRENTLFVSVTSFEVRNLLSLACRSLLLPKPAKSLL